MVWSITKRLFIIAVSILGVRLGNAILNLLDIKPELWILGHIMTAPTEAWLEVVRWTIALCHPTGGN